MLDIVTFGSAAQDVFVRSKSFLPISGKHFSTEKRICLPWGVKIQVENIFLASGGGGTNTAATFTKQNLRTAYCGMVGEDYFGEVIIKELRKLGISTRFVSKIKGGNTNTSVFLTYPGTDRTALVYRGASDLLLKKDISWEKIRKAKWFYLAPFSGAFTRLTDKIINFAKENKIKIALNPGYNQLILAKKRLQKILENVDILILNKEEASLLTKIPYRKEKEIFLAIDRLCPGITIMTKGDKGVVASDGNCLYRAGSLKTKVVDKTGAGDAFGAGFVSGIIHQNNIIHAIQLGTANAAGCIGKMGAKEGILKANNKWSKIFVAKESCSIKNLCQLKAV